jgi:hypothetical protein
MPRDSGSPFRSVIRWIFDPGLPRSVGFGPVGGPFCGPQADGVDRAPGPVQLVSRSEFVENHAVKPSPDPVAAPLGEPAVHRGPGRAEHRRQLPPGAARRRHEDDRGQGFAVTGPAPPSALRTYHLSRWHHLPEQQPRLVRHESLNEIRHARINEPSRHKKRRFSTVILGIGSVPSKRGRGPRYERNDCIAWAHLLMNSTSQSLTPCDPLHA